MIIRNVKALVAVSCIFVAQTSWANLVEYTQDFESLNAADGASLTNDGWLVFGNVFDGSGNYKFGYGPFGAPNGGSGFSAIDSGQGGAAQGSQQLSIYNDYNCCALGGNPTDDEGHGNGTDIVEQTIGTGDIGSLWTFAFDAKEGNIAGSSTAAAFIKVLDSTTFETLAFLTFDTTNIGTSWSGGSIDINIDAAWDGDLLQFGFLSTASNFEGSGVFYDNVSLTLVPIPAAAWLFASGLGLLGWVRRRASRPA
jgi:hypothetical protein